MQRILVPIDGSAESERALGIAQPIAAAQGAEILLVQVLDPSTWARAATAEEAVAIDIYTEIQEAAEADAKSHLTELEGRIRTTGGRARSAVLEGPPSATLLDYETQERVDLLVMATHGRSGLARFALGSVTDRMIREGSAPVLVIRRSGSISNHLERALVMLDGSDLSEQALPMVRALARKPLRSATLFRAVRDPQNHAAAVSYLEGHAAQLAQGGFQVDVLAEDGEPRELVERIALGYDLVILSTHGRGGFDRLRHGSVAEHVTREVDKPALLVRAGMQVSG